MNYRVLHKKGFCKTHNLFPYVFKTGLANYKIFCVHYFYRFYFKLIFGLESLDMFLFYITNIYFYKFDTKLIKNKINGNPKVEVLT